MKTLSAIALVITLCTPTERAQAKELDFVPQGHYLCRLDIEFEQICNQPFIEWLPANFVIIRVA